MAMTIEEAANAKIDDNGFVTGEKPKKVSQEDQQTIEILYLKIENLKLQERLLQADIIKAGSQKTQLQQELMMKAEEFRQKYGIVLGHDKIAPDGTIISVPSPNSVS